MLLSNSSKFFLLLLFILEYKISTVYGNVKCHKCTHGKCNGRNKEITTVVCEVSCFQGVLNDGKVTYRGCGVDEEEGCKNVEHDSFDQVCNCKEDLCNAESLFNPTSNEIAVAETRSLTKCYTCWKRKCDPPFADGGMKIIQCPENCEKKINEEGNVISRGCACNNLEGCKRVETKHYSQVCNCKGDLCNGEDSDSPMQDSGSKNKKSGKKDKKCKGDACDEEQAQGSGKPDKKSKDKKCKGDACDEEQAQDSGKPDKKSKDKGRSLSLPEDMETTTGMSMMMTAGEKVKCYKCRHHVDCNGDVNEMRIIECNGFCDMEIYANDTVTYRGCGRFEHEGCRDGPRGLFSYLCGCKGDLCNAKSPVSDMTQPVIWYSPDSVAEYKPKLQCYSCSKEECSQPLQNMTTSECAYCGQVITSNGSISERKCFFEDIYETCREPKIKRENIHALCTCNKDYCNGISLFDPNVPGMPPMEQEKPEGRSFSVKGKAKHSRKN